MDATNLINRYNADSDWLVKENANKYDSYTKMRGYVADEIIKEYCLNKIYSSEIAQLHKEGYFHIHDLADGVVPYCAGHDVALLLVKGLKTNTVVAGPPRHLNSFFNQLINFLATSQQEWAGAQAVADLNTFAAPFARKDKLTHKKIRQIIQSFIFDLNFPSRSGGQTPFVNVTLNYKCPDHLKDQSVLNEGCDGVYGDYEKEGRAILKEFNKIFYGGDWAGRPFTFPITTISLLPSTDFGDPLWKDLMKTESKYGTYSFMNYINSGISPNSIYALCCRLRLDLEQLPSAWGRWAFERGTGSLGVTSLNMGRVGYLARKGEGEGLFGLLDTLLEKAKESLLLKAKFVDKYKEKYMPLTMEYGFSPERFFRTIGIIGLNEMSINYSGLPLWSDVGLIKDVLEYIRDWTRRTQKETGVLWNFEQTPGEGSATRLALIDKEKYGKGIYAQGRKGAWYYSTMITPPNAPLLFGERVRIEEQLLPLLTGGCIFRAYIGEANPSAAGLLKITEWMVKETRIPSFDFAPTYSICSECARHNRGAVPTCYECGGTTVTYDRIVGYYRGREQANVGKLQEIRERRRYDLSSL